MARDWAFIRYMTATSFGRNAVPSSSSARRVSQPDFPVWPTSPSIWRAIHSASSSSLKASNRWIGTPPWFSVQSFLSVRRSLRDTTAWAASRITFVER